MERCVLSVDVCSECGCAALEDKILYIAKGSERFYIQRGEQVFDTLPILQVFLLTKHVEVFYHRYTSTVRDGI